MPQQPALPQGTHVIYFGSICDESAESYSIESLCDCDRCATPATDAPHRYRLRGEHVRWDQHSRTYKRVGGMGLAHVSADHIMPSPDGPQPWQINQETLSEHGIHRSI